MSKMEEEITFAAKVKICSEQSKEVRNRLIKMGPLKKPTAKKDLTVDMIEFNKIRNSLMQEYRKIMRPIAANEMIEKKPINSKRIYHYPSGEKFRSLEY